ncbi:MAG: LPS-assembly protein LptD [Planctomycetota bacterium]
MTWVLHSKGSCSIIRTLLLALTVLPALFCAIPTSLAQEAGESTDYSLKATSSDGRVLVIAAEFITSFTEGDHKVVLLHGNVEVKYDNAQIMADSVVLWFDYSEMKQIQKIMGGKDFEYGYRIPALPAGRDSINIGPLPYGGASPLTPPSAGDAINWAGDPVEFYAEGNVRITQDEACFYCDQVYSNLVENRGALVNGEIVGTTLISEKKHPIHFKFSMLKKVCDKLYTMEGVSFSTCVFGVPHYELHIDSTRLEGDFTDGILDIEDPSFRIRGINAPLPDTSVQIGRNWYFPVKRVKVGGSSRYGNYVFITLGEDFDQLGQAAHSFLGINAPFRGDAELDIDVMEDRGLGLGPNLEYESPGLYKGYTRGYYLNDSEDQDRNGFPIDQHKRGRIRTQNRVQVEKDTLLDLELSYITDAGFLEEFFEDERKTDKEQETYAYLHHEKGSNAWSVLGNVRLNDFQTQNEYYPQARWDITSTPFAGGSGPREVLGFFDFTGIFYDQRTEVSQVRNRPSNFLPLPSERITRGDYEGTFEMPLRVGYFEISPFYKNRLSFFERTQGDSEATGRVVESYGTRFGFLMHTKSDFSSEFLNIHGVRNIIEPSVVYRNNFAITKESDELIPFDSMEDATRGELVALELHHRLQTRNPEAKSTTHTFYESMFVLPVYRDRKLSPDGHRMGNLNYFTWITPLFTSPWFKNMRIAHKGEFDPNDKNFMEHNSRLTLRPHPDYAFNFWHSWVRNRKEDLSFSVRRFLTDKWEVETGLRYDIEQSRTGDRFIILRRKAHQWLFEVEASMDEGDDDSRIQLSITPLALFDIQDKGTIHDPMQAD